MTDPSSPQTPQLDQILSRAVDRQLDEQRALRQALNDLRDAVRAVGSADTSEVDDRWRRELNARIVRIDDEIQQLATLIADVKEPGRAMAALAGDVEDMRADVATIKSEVTGVGEGVSAVSSDAEGIATALVELNSNLRTWTDGLDDRIERLHALATSIKEAEPPEAVIERIEGVQHQLKETADLSLYLSDQIDDLDRILGKLGELPDRLEGVIAQAVRRTLVTRAKIEQDAQAAVDEAVGGLDDAIDRLDDALRSFNADDLAKLLSAHADLAMRMDALSERVDGTATTHHDALRALAKAVGVPVSQLKAPSKKKAPPKAKASAAKRKPAKRKASARRKRSGG